MTNGSCATSALAVAVAGILLPINSVRYWRVGFILYFILHIISCVIFCAKVTIISEITMIMHTNFSVLFYFLTFIRIYLNPWHTNYTSLT